MLTYTDLRVARTLTVAHFVLALLAPPGWPLWCAVAGFALSVAAWNYLEDRRAQ